MSVSMTNSVGDIREFDSLQDAYAAGYNQKTPLCEYCAAPAIDSCRTPSGPRVKCCATCREKYSKDWAVSKSKVIRPVGRPRKNNF